MKHRQKFFLFYNSCLSISFHLPLPTRINSLSFALSECFRCNSNFRALTGNYFLEETDAGQYGNSNDWSGMRWSWPGVMGNQQNPDTNPTAATISAGSSLTLSIHIGGSGNTYYNKTKNQSNSTSRSWFRLTELDGTL